MKWEVDNLQKFYEAETIYIDRAIPQLFYQLFRVHAGQPIRHTVNCIPTSSSQHHITLKIYFINFHLVNFPLCQFPLCQHWPNGNWQSGNWLSGKLMKWELTKWELTKWELTKWELTKWEDTYEYCCTITHNIWTCCEHHLSSRFEKNLLYTWPHAVLHLHMYTGNFHLY